MISRTGGATKDMKKKARLSLHEGPQDLSGLGKRNMGSPDPDMLTRHMDSEVVF